MKKSAIIWTVVILVVVGIGIWAFSSMNGTDQYSATQDNSNPGQQASGSGNLTPLTLNTMVSPSSTIGTYIVASNGMTLYRYTPDTKNTSNCSGQCAVYWPPYTVSSSDQLAGGTGINGQISTITRKDGTMQVIYKGMPLYFWAKDKAPGDTTGQNVMGVWFVVNP